MEKKIVFMPGASQGRSDGERTWLDGGILVTEEDYRRFEREDRIMLAESIRVRTPERFAELFPDWPIDKPYTG